MCSFKENLLENHFYDLDEGNNKCCILFDPTVKKRKQVAKMNDARCEAKIF